jgi:iron complex transport system substrate-binding protein
LLPGLAGRLPGVVLAVAIVALFAGSHWARSRLESQVPKPPPGTARRIISMAPSVTEVLFALGLGDRVVAVTRYCMYPPEVRQKPRIGGYMDPNFEAMVALRPDLVITLEGVDQQDQAFAKLGLPLVVVCHKSVDGILQSIETIGRAGGVPDRAARIVADLRARLDRVRRKTAGLGRPRVMFSVDRTPGTGHIEDAYIAGADGHIDRIIEIAGGANAYPGRVRFPVISSEGILRMNPQVIVDMVPRLSPGASREEVRADWNELGAVEAVARDRVYVLDQDYVSVPGPRVILFVEQLARLIHPEADWAHP